MTDYQRTVDELRSFLHATDQTYRDSLKKLAAEYSKACDEVNERLRRCEEYLQKGLRSEAIQFAQAEPILLEVVAALDIPEREQWEELSFLYGLQPPPRLRIETAEALNRAYAEEQPLEQLLRQHRRLALTGAGLVERLHVMRSIAAVDKENGVWSEDIAEFERARLQKMREELRRALSENDNDTLFARWDELQETPWRAPEAAEVTAFIEQEVGRRKHLGLRRGLERAAVKLAQAHASLDETTARSSRDQWSKLNSEARLAREDPLWRQAAPALQWLASLDRRQSEEFGLQAALEKLESALARDVEVEELQELYYAARQYKRGMPVALEERYRQQIDGIKAVSTRKERYILAATFSAGAVVLVAFLLFVLLRH
jgi:hypothetical protein